MVIISKVLYWWNSVKSFGSGEDLEENLVLALINQMGLIGSLAFIFVFPTFFLFEAPGLHHIVPFVFGLSILLTLVFNYKNKTQYSKYIITIVHPILVSIYMVLTGGNFGEESILVVSIFMVYTLYYRSRQQVIRLYIFMFSLYFGAEIFLLTKGSLLSQSGNLVGESIGFLMSVVWIWKIVKVYRKQRLVNEKGRLDLIEVLQEKNNNLEKSSTELEQFTYIASHDLKSPLRTIISFLGLIQRDISRKKYADLLPLLDFARNGADQMSQLLQDILNYSRILGTERADNLEVDLNVVVAQVKQNLKDTLEKKGGEIILDELPTILGNDTLVTTLLQHIIENGLKYNESDRPEICISSEIKGKFLCLQFEDNGIGIEEQYFDKIFLLFKRLHTNVYYKGTGLGLGICKKILDNMGGSITISSEINLGTTFTVKIPVEKVLSSPLKVDKNFVSIPPSSKTQVYS